jgi:acetylglutamate kinase
MAVTPTEKPAQTPTHTTAIGHIIVIKYGGSVMNDPTASQIILERIAQLRNQGLSPVIVHGGGPSINAHLSRLAKAPQYIEGLRVTDAETFEIVEMVLAGQTNKALVGRLQALGTSAIGVCGRDADLIVAHQKQLDGHAPDALGQVGTVHTVNAALIQLLLSQGIIPVIAPICSDGQGNGLNVNADEVAVAVAQALQAEQLLFFTDVPGVMDNPSDPASVIPFLSVDEAQVCLQEKRITGGMIPKLQSAIQSVERGVKFVQILDGKHPDTLQCSTPDHATAVGTILYDASVWQPPSVQNIPVPVPL